MALGHDLVLPLQGDRDHLPGLPRRQCLSAGEGCLERTHAEVLPAPTSVLGGVRGRTRRAVGCPQGRVTEGSVLGLSRTHLGGWSGLEKQARPTVLVGEPHGQYPQV